MTFEEARIEAAKLVGGRYHSLYYTFTDLGTGTVRQYCRIYVDPGISTGECATWTEALLKLPELLGYAVVSAPIIEPGPADVTDSGVGNA